MDQTRVSALQQIHDRRAAAAADGSDVLGRLEGMLRHIRDTADYGITTVVTATMAWHADPATTGRRIDDLAALTHAIADEAAEVMEGLESARAALDDLCMPDGPAGT